MSSKQLFDNWLRPQAEFERIVFVGCVHTTSDELLFRLRQIAENPPNYLIFGGDLTGSKQMEHLKMLFYECVMNRAKGQLGEKIDSTSDNDLLDFVGHCPYKPEQTLSEGYQELIAYTLKIQELEESEVQQRIGKLNSKEIAKGIRAIAKMQYFGCDWHLKLPIEVRRATAAGLQEDAKKLVEAIKPIADQGTKVIMIGGNWDNLESNRKGNFGEDVDVFDTVNFYREQGFDFFTEADYITTNRSVMVFLPYWDLCSTKKEIDEKILRRTNGTPRGTTDHTKLTIIAVAHGEPCWEPHNLSSPITPEGDRGKVIANLGNWLAKLRPDRVVYPHQHGHLHDQNNNRLPLGTEYLLERDQDSVSLVRNCPQNLKDITIATYIPIHRAAELKLPRKSNPRPILFGGNGEEPNIF